MRRRAAAGLSHADADAEEQQHREALRRAAQGGHEAPYQERRRDHLRTRGAVGQPGDRDAEGGVEDGEGESGEQPELGVGEPEVALDRLLQDGDDLAVDEVEDVDDEEDAERVPTIAVAGGRFVHREG